MVRPPCCDKVGIKKGPWTPEEDVILISFIQENGPGNWSAVPASTGLLRCSKSCRLRWTNYLRPGIKRGNFTPHEEGMIIHLQALLGNKWAAIATYLPQRTDNDIKNFWNTHLKKKLKKLQSAAMAPQEMARIGGQNVAEVTSLHASSAENISIIRQSWISSSSSSLQGNTMAASSDLYVNCDKFYRDFGKIPAASCDASDELQWQSGITGDDHELEKILPLDRGLIDNVASTSCDSSRIVDQGKVHIVHDQEGKKINGNPPFPFLEDWLLEENDEGGMENLPIF